MELVQRRAPEGHHLGGPGPGRRRGPLRRRHPRGARVLAPRRRRAPRHQARQRHGDRCRPGQGHGLRHRPRGLRLVVDRRRDDRDHRHRRLLLARAGQGRAGRRPRRPVLRPASCSTSSSPAARRSAASRPSPWPTSTSARHPLAAVRGQRGRPARARRRRAARPREGSVPALPGCRARSATRSTPRSAASAPPQAQLGALTSELYGPNPAPGAETARSLRQLSTDTTMARTQSGPPGRVDLGGCRSPRRAADLGASSGCVTIRPGSEVPVERPASCPTSPA